MAETINISKMAEKLSSGIFREFLWRKLDHTNINWACDHVEEHGSSTHPSDVVFWYDEPYSPSRTYVTCDLKSYARSSINKTTIVGAIESLAKAVRCAETSRSFQEKFIDDQVTSNVFGLLFVYNHDSDYDKDFGKILAEVNADELEIPKGSKVVVFGPDDIFWLNNVHHEITRLRGGEGLIPDRDLCKFFYPHLVRKKNVQPEKARAATLEMLTGPWIILSYDQKGTSGKGFVVFVRSEGTSVDEFLYLIESLMHFQVITEESKVSIRLLRPSESSSTNFSKAKHRYVDEFDGGEEIGNILDKIDLGKIEHVLTSFCEMELSRQ